MTNILEVENKMRKRCSIESCFLKKYNTLLLYNKKYSSDQKKQNNNDMKWNELRRIAERHAFILELLRFPQYDQISRFGGHQPFAVTLVMFSWDSRVLKIRTQIAQIYADEGMLVCVHL